MSEDVSVERLSVAEAAEALGVTRDAIHKRITRGSIRYEKGEDGRFYVYVDTPTKGLDTSKDASKVEALERLIEDQRDQITYLRAELARRAETHTEESRRKDSIIAALTQRIPELEPPAPPESPEPREPGPYRVRPERAEPVEPVDPRREEPARVEPQRVESERTEPRESPEMAADEQQGRGPVPDEETSTSRRWWEFWR